MSVSTAPTVIDITTFPSSAITSLRAIEFDSLKAKHVSDQKLEDDLPLQDDEVFTTLFKTELAKATESDKIDISLPTHTDAAKTEETNNTVDEGVSVRASKVVQEWSLQKHTMQAMQQAMFQSAVDDAAGVRLEKTYDLRGSYFGESEKETKDFEVLWKEVLENDSSLVGLRRATESAVAAEVAGQSGEESEVEEEEMTHEMKEVTGPFCV